MSDVKPGSACNSRFITECSADAIRTVGKASATIVFLVRHGNPKGIKDWDDLIKDVIEVITPNPKTSGGPRWNYLAVGPSPTKNTATTKARTRTSSRNYANVPVLDTGARGSTTTFAQRDIGDVLLAWENEAFLALDELGGDKLEIVVPSLSRKADRRLL
jgi:sulfate transport system substrate-binding protein